MILWDINIAGAEETAEMIRKIGGSATAFKVDVTNREEVYRIAQQVRNEIAEVTMLINNAGIVSGKKIFDPDNSDGYMEKTMQVNTISHFWTVKAFMPAMIAKDHGHLITIASSAGLVGVNGLADYCASKFGNNCLSILSARCLFFCYNCRYYFRCCRLPRICDSGTALHEKEKCEDSVCKSLLHQHRHVRWSHHQVRILVNNTVSISLHTFPIPIGLLFHSVRFAMQPRQERASFAYS